MRTIILNGNFYHKRVTYTLISRDKKGIEVEAIMGSGRFQFYHPDSWRNFKKWISK